MVNTAINHFKANKKHKFYEELDSDHTQTNNTNDEENVSVYGDFKQEQLMQLINDLPDGYRMVFNLYVFEGMSHKEIAGIMNFKESTSKSQLSKARRLLRVKLLELQKSRVEV